MEQITINGGAKGEVKSMQIIVSDNINGDVHLADQIWYISLRKQSHATTLYLLVHFHCSNFQIRPNAKVNIYTRRIVLPNEATKPVRSYMIPVELR